MSVLWMAGKLRATPGTSGATILWNYRPESKAEAAQYDGKSLQTT